MFSMELSNVTKYHQLSKAERNLNENGKIW